MGRRIASRAWGGVPKKPLKKERCLLVGCARVRVQDLIVPLCMTRKGERAWPLLTWKQATGPAAWQGRVGQEGSGTVEVWPSTTWVLGTLPALAPVTRAVSIAREQISIARPSADGRTPRGAPVAGTPGENLDIALLLSLSDTA